MNGRFRWMARQLPRLLPTSLTGSIRPRLKLNLLQTRRLSLKPAGEQEVAMKKALWLTLALCVHTAAQGAGDVEAGRVLFTKTCGGCHKIGPQARSAFGPQLNAVLGRRAGETSDYKYSAPMQASGIVWTRKKLSAFIQDPSEVVPGTKMNFWGISDQQKIEDLLAYLESNP